MRTRKPIGIAGSGSVRNRHDRSERLRAGRGQCRLPAQCLPGKPGRRRMAYRPVRRGARPERPGVDQEPDQPQRRSHHRSAGANVHASRVAFHRGQPAVVGLAREDPDTRLGLGTAGRSLCQRVRARQASRSHTRLEVRRAAEQSISTSTPSPSEPRSIFASN